MTDTNSKPQNESGELADTVFDEDLFEEEFKDGYEEGYVDAKSGDETSDEQREGVSVVPLSSPVLQKRENTRSNLAIIYTLLTFTVFLSGMLIAVVDGLTRKVSIIDNLQVVIPLISGVFLGTLGFVLGYYFRKEEEESN